MLKATSSLTFRPLLCSAAIAGCVFLGSAATAQLNNQPFSFNTPGGGVGMSTAGQQAILNEKIYGIRPDNMTRDVNGSLMSVQKGPGGVALVTEAGTGQIIPKYHGTSYRDGAPGMSVGTFNAFFVPSSQLGGYSSVASVHSGATVSTWTGRVVTNAPMSYLGDRNTVDTWTGNVYMNAN